MFMDTSHGLTAERACSRAWIEINLKNLRHNIALLRTFLQPNSNIIAVAKADAYGHKANIVVPCMQEMGIRSFAVATLGEAIELREAGITGTILILGHTDPLFLRELLEYRITQTVIDKAHGIQLDAAAAQAGQIPEVHLKIDSGMHRLGIDTRQPEDAAAMFALENLNITGIYTHLAATDSIAGEDIAYTRRQIDAFNGLLRTLQGMNIQIPLTHMQNSYGLLNYPDVCCDSVRIGASLYGMGSKEPHKSNVIIDLRPVLSLRARIVMIRTLEKGECFGYGMMFRADRKSRIAILPLGYVEGLPRKLACGRGTALVHGRRVPFAGLVCMDQLALDVTDVPDAKPGDTVTLIGRDGEEEIGIVDVAEAAETLHVEILCRIGQRVATVVIDE
ncbi:MAG: alanine racemase [Eubacteriales bacterium]|nr:alanine racemase [Eubacteriales bacterium]HPF19445.1 alanine racemase [Bacillota bacterium]